MSTTAYRTNVVRTVAKRDLRSTLYGIGMYFVLTLIFLAVSYVSIRNSLFQVTENGLWAFPSPINAPFFFSIGLAATYLGLVSAISISRERDQGTLEVLFYGPVDSFSYVMAKYVQQMISFLVVLVMTLGFFAAISAYTNLGFSGNLAGILLLSFFLASCMIAFGIFLSSASNKVITSVVLFLGLMLFFLIFQVAHQVVLAMPGQKLSTVLVYVRIALDNMNKVVQWISPLGYLDRGAVAINLGNATQYLWSLLSSLGYTAVLLWLSMLSFNRKGVRR